MSSRGLFRDNAYLLLVLAPLGWACNAIASRLAVGQVSPMSLTFFRWAGVVALLLLFARREIAPHAAALRARWMYVSIMGILAFTVFNSLFYVAAHYTTAVNIGLLQGAIPAMVFVVARVMRGTRASLAQVAGAGITLCGIAVIAAAGNIATLLALKFNAGDVMMLGASLSWALYTVGLQSRPDVPPVAFFGGLAIVAVITTFPLWIAEITLGQFFWPTPFGWGLLVFITIVPSIMSQVFFVRGVELIGPGRAGLFTNLIPVFASGLAVLLLGEQFHLYHAVALAMVLGGIALAEAGKGRARQTGARNRVAPASRAL